MGIAQIVAISGLAIAVLGVVWRASAIATALVNIERTLEKIQESLGEHRETISMLKTSVARLEERTPPRGTRMKWRKGEDDGNP